MYFILYTFVLSLLLSASSAQHAPLPSGTYGQAYMRAGRYFHIQGGIAYDNAQIQILIAQHYALDLGVPWTTAAPVWKKFTDGRSSLGPGGNGEFLSGVASADNQTLYTFETLENGIAVGIYSVSEDTWIYTNYTNSVAMDTTKGGFWPVLDPTSDVIFINGLINISQYNTKTNSWMDTIQKPPNTLNRIYGRAAYIPSIKSVLIVGGYQMSLVWDTKIDTSEYNIGLGYSVLETTGDSPSGLSDFCMARSEDGSRIVVQGGRMQRDQNTTTIEPSGFSYDMFVLNVLTKTWTKGAPMPAPRMYSACVVVGDQFITWGGSLGDVNSNPGQQSIASNGVLIFDLTSLQWINSYEPPSYMSQSPNTTSPPSQTSTQTPTSIPEPSPGSNKGAIIGGVAGGVIVLGLIIGLIVFKHKKSIDRKDSNSEYPQSIHPKTPRNYEYRNPQHSERINDLDPRSPQLHGISSEGSTLTVIRLADPHTIPENSQYSHSP